MAVFLGVACEGCGVEHRPDRPVRSFSPGAVRTRAAFHGWTQREEHGVTVDLCPGCASQVVVAARVVPGRVLVGATRAADPPRPPVGAPVLPPAGLVHPVAVDVEVRLCRWCEDAEHQWCTGCDCPAH